MPPPVVAVGSGSVQDSIIGVNAAFGTAEKFEEGMNLKSGSINVYTYKGENASINNPKTMADVASLAGRLTFVVIDSIHVQKPQVVKNNVRKSFSGISCYSSIVDMPYSFRISVHNMGKSAPLHCYFEADTMRWELMSVEPITENMASLKARDGILQRVKTMLYEVTGNFFPSWHTGSCSLAYFPGEQWERAIELAGEFRWEEALDIWMKLSKTTSADKVQYAALNAATALEILGQSSLSKAWFEVYEQYKNQ